MLIRTVCLTLCSIRRHDDTYQAHHREVLRGLNEGYNDNSPATVLHNYADHEKNGTRFDLDITELRIRTEILVNLNLGGRNVVLFSKNLTRNRSKVLSNLCGIIILLPGLLRTDITLLWISGVMTR